MTTLYPLRFAPLFRRYLWGGRRLETVLGKTLPPGEDYAESWEIVDRDGDQSRVVAGTLAGATLGELIERFPQELLGSSYMAAHEARGGSARPRFPLLLKFLDAQRDLSVQVHPDDVRAARLDPPDLGKTEAWVILQANPGACLYAGLKRGFDRAALEREVRRGTTPLCLQRFEPKAGDCFFIPAGTVHALGAGLLVAEIQQSSDTTYRLFDWNRVGADGRPRPLHLEAAMDAIDYTAPPLAACRPKPLGEGAERLVDCDQFVLERWPVNGKVAWGGDGRCRIVTVVDGAIAVAGDPDSRPLGRGESMLLPANQRVTADGMAVSLIAYVP
ncbi:MAG: putative mannose-6-phosphate isomerase YvyI [Planctomycetota bacterium]|jgi:mannose-6-phosphate isomerase